MQVLALPISIGGLSRSERLYQHALRRGSHNYIVSCFQRLCVSSTSGHPLFFAFISVLLASDPPAREHHSKNSRKPNHASHTMPTYDESTLSWVHQQCVTAIVFIVLACLFPTLLIITRKLNNPNVPKWGWDEILVIPGMLVVVALCSLLIGKQSPIGSPQTQRQASLADLKQTSPKSTPSPIPKSSTPPSPTQP